MSTIRATYVQHGSSAVPNITLNASGQVIVASGLVSSGTFAAPSGTAAAPGVYFVGDADTGLYSPGANQVAISTSGVEAAIVSSDLLRIPSGSLTIQKQGSNPNYNMQRAEGTLALPTAITSSVIVGNLVGAGYDGTAYRNIGSIRFTTDGAISSTSSPGFITFNTTASGSTSVTERMRIDAAGRVGVGTSTPDSNSKLDVSGGALNLSDDNVLAWGGGSSRTYIGGSKAAGTLIFASAGTEAFRVDGSRRLLVGTSSNRTGAALQVEGTTFGTSLATIANNSANSNPAYFQLIKSRGTTVGSQTLVSNGDGLGNIQFVGTDGTQQLVAAAIEGIVDGTPGTNDMPGRLVFSTTADGASSPTERLRINNAGSTYYVATSQVLDLVTTVGAGSTNLINGRHSGTAGTPASGTLSFVVVSNGNVQNTNNSYGAISDAKLKENIVDAASQWDDIKALQVRKYNFKESTGHETHTQIGLVAQEAELVSPGLISESPDRDEDGNDLGTVTKSVNYSVLYMKAVKALQEAMERIETLEAKVAALESA